MTALSKLLAGAGAFAAIAVAAPASAQYYSNYGGYPGYGAPGYGYPGYNGGFGPNRQVAVNQCSAAAQARLGGYGYGDYGSGRVLGISQVLPRGDGGFTIRGVASSGRYGYAYGAAGQPDLTWRCVTDVRGFVREVSMNQAAPAYGNGYNYSPYDDDFSEYGYRRY